ncbi:3'-5' exonuclease-like isoform X2 [Amaranthus tricolor]|uniref:3'-5' exonuclease-like isoform X2 n=1 Tax=Amaranthus tricolor TaxID=29722 RepID=UPI0025885901|nr:3'-5' exonuclease-like isoform X2 [Amaranthus tricolor]
MKNSSEERHFTATRITTQATIINTSNYYDDWDKPFSIQDLEAIEAAFDAATSKPLSSTPSSSSSTKTPRSSSSIDDDDTSVPPKTRRRLPGTISGSNGVMGSPKTPGSVTLTPCSSKWNSRQGNVKMNHPAMNFGGRIVYSRTIEQVEQSTLQVLRLLEAKKSETGRAVIGIDIEWKPSFNRGIPQGKAAVMQICGDMTHCYVLHIIHSGIPDILQSLLENSTYIKVGVGIYNDSVKVFHDHNVSIKGIEDLSCLANQKLGGVPKQWSLSSLVETLTCKQLLKPKKIRLGNWEVGILSKAQLQYAATDAFASWYLYEVNFIIVLFLIWPLYNLITAYIRCCRASQIYLRIRMTTTVPNL